MEYNLLGVLEIKLLYKVIEKLDWHLSEPMSGTIIIDE
jgi:hypothetical protein